MSSAFDGLDISQESSEYDYNPDTLDYLYKEQLRVVRELIFKDNQTHDIELCHRWLKVFSKTTKEEKIARNCLINLMQQQLQEFGYLSLPFTNIQNCNRNLEMVLQEIDRLTTISENFTEQEDEKDLETFASHQHHQHKQYQYEYDDINEDEQENVVNEVDNLEKRCSAGQSCHDGPLVSIIKEKSPTGTLEEWRENETQAEIVMLRQKLEMMRLQLTEKHIENLKLKEMTDRLEIDNSRERQIMDRIKVMLVEAIKDFLDKDQSKEDFPFDMFQTIFYKFNDDVDFWENMKIFDAHFKDILKKAFENELEKNKHLISQSIFKKFNKSKDKIKNRYERRLKTQNWAQRLQLKLVKLKCFSVLRNIFIKAQQGYDPNMWDMLLLLEEKYQSIVNEII